MNVVVIGLQFGDEGKGKVVDYLSQDFDIVARFSGGSNAGHTVKVDGQEFKLHLLPSGVLRGKKGVLGSGMAVDMELLSQEVEELESRGFSVDILISSRAHVVTSLHKEMDAIEDEVRRIGTTKRGIGPTYEAKAKRLGIRVGELFNETLVAHRLRLLARLWGMNDGDVEGEARRLKELAEKFKERIVDTEIWLNNAIDSGKSVLFEGSQAVLLDIDFGTYPYVTSSSTIPGGVSTGLGVPPKKIHKVIGVMKPYMTRVGMGPFPTELSGDEAEKLREKGGEYGATTGRPRRVGWLDMPLLRYASMISGVDEIALTKVDVLQGMEEVPVAWEYSCHGERHLLPPMELELCSPVYRRFPGWRSIDEPEFREFLRMVEEETGARVGMVSYGAEREKTTASWSL